MRILNYKHLHWDMNPTGTTGTAGTFLKAYAAPYYYKLSAGSIGSGIYGHEAANEVIVSRLLHSLNIACVEYTGCMADICINGKLMREYVCKSKEFKQKHESKQRLETFYELHCTQGESMIQFLQRKGFTDYVDTLLFVDFLIINRDRHGANIEVLYDKNTKAMRLAPIFDNGVSFVSPYQNDLEAIRKFNPMLDVQTTNVLGTNSLITNLQYITTPVIVTPLTPKILSNIFYGLHGVLTDVHIKKIKEIIETRYAYAKCAQILRER